MINREDFIVGTTATLVAKDGIVLQLGLAAALTFALSVWRTCKKGGCA